MRSRIDDDHAPHHASRVAQSPQRRRAIPSGRTGCARSTACSSRIRNSRRSTREQAPAASLETIALCHPMDYVEEIRDAVAEGRPGAARRRHLDVAGQLRGGAARGRRRDARGRRGRRQEGRQRLLSRMRPPGHHAETRAADGLLHLQPGRDRGAPRAEEARPAPRRGGRFRRASRQRHAGDLLVRRDADVLLDPPDAALSRHRRGLRARRARQHRQRAAARRRRRRAVPRRDGEPHPAAACSLRRRS